ncbi:AAA family ATPase [Streptomyces graminilatus]|uniref:AAA family ATPase n=1 Tax=Streptomyces graminilatus TaxID=1464070 RepID=UPI0006E35278|nr:AAA family ATPase [Streptomyces graminilatus]
MTNTSSPLATGGGGIIYEYWVAALDAAAMLCHVPVPGLKVPATQLLLQKGPRFPLDDVIVLNREGPFELTVQRQVKRTLDIAPSSAPWRSTIGQCLESLQRYGEDIDAGRHRLGITASGPDNDLIALRNLATAADAQSTCDDLNEELPRLGKAERTVWRHLKATLASLPEASGAVAAHQVEETAFRIARRLVVEIEQAEQDGPRYISLLGLLEERLLEAGRGPGAAEVFRKIAAIVEKRGPRAGTMSVTDLRNELHVRGAVLRGDPPELPALDAVRRWTEGFLGAERVSQRLGGRLHLARKRQAGTLRTAVSEHERVLLTGPAGAGKSALARELARTAHESGGTVVALSLTERTWHTVTDIGEEIGARLDRTLAAAPGGERLLLVDGAEQVLTDSGALLSSLLKTLPHASTPRWHVLAVVREQAADQVGAVLAEAGRHPVHRVEAQELDDGEVDSVLAEFPALRVLERSARSARLLRNLYLVEQLVLMLGPEHHADQVLGEEDVADWVYKDLVRRNDGGRPGRGTPDERSDAYLDMADAVLAGHSHSGLRGRAGPAREGLVGDGVLVFEDAEFAFAHDVQQDYAIAVRLGMNDAPDVAAVPVPRRLLRGVRLGFQLRLSRAVGRGPARLVQTWRTASAEADRLADVDDVRWLDVPYEALFELGRPDAVCPALATVLLDGGGGRLVAAAGRRVRDAESAVPVLELLLTQPERLDETAAAQALRFTATWLGVLADRTPDELLRRVPAAVAWWYDGRAASAQDAAVALAWAAGDLDGAARRLVQDLAAEHPLKVQAVVEDRRLGALLALHEPALLAAMSHAFYLGPVHDRLVDAHDGVRDRGWPFLSRIGRDLDPKRPDPAYLGPFALLLDHAPELGLVLVGAVAGAASAAVSERERDHDRGVRQASVTWPLRGGERTFTGSATVWQWPWAGAFGPGPALAALAALRRWAGARAAAGADLAEVVEQVLGCGESIALVAVAVDVLAEHPVRLSTELDPALEQRDVWLLPGTPCSLHDAVPYVVLRASPDRQRAYRLLGRRLLEEYTPVSQPPSTAHGLEDRQAIVDHQVVRTMAALLDHTQWRLVDLPEGRGRALVNDAVREIRSEADEDEGAFHRFIERFALADDARKARDGADGVDAQRLFERLTVLDASLELDPDPEGLWLADGRRAAVAAVLIQTAAADAAAVEAWQMRWAGNQLVAAAAATPPAITRRSAGEVVCEAKEDRAGDCSAALVLPLLLGDDGLQQQAGLTGSDVRAAVTSLATSAYIEVRAFLADSLTARWTPACTGPDDPVHTGVLEALTAMVASAGLSPQDEAGVRYPYRLPDPVHPVLTGGEPVLDLRLAAPAVAAAHQVVRTDCAHQADAGALLAALTTHDRLTWTAQSPGMAGHARGWRVAHAEVTAQEALAGHRRLLEESLDAFTDAPAALTELLLALARLATTADRIAQLLTLWPGLLDRFLTPGRQPTALLRRALLPSPAGGMPWPPGPSWTLTATWAKAHCAQPVVADHLIEVLDAHRLFTTSAVDLVLDVLGTRVNDVAVGSLRAVTFLRRVLTDLATRSGASADRARRLLDALAAAGYGQALRAQRDLEDAPSLY